MRMRLILILVQLFFFRSIFVSQLVFGFTFHIRRLADVWCCTIYGTVRAYPANGFSLWSAWGGPFKYNRMYKFRDFLTLRAAHTRTRGVILIQHSLTLSLVFATRWMHRIVWMELNRHASNSIRLWVSLFHVVPPIEYDCFVGPRSPPSVGSDSLCKCTHIKLAAHSSICSHSGIGVGGCVCLRATDPTRYIFVRLSFRKRFDANSAQIMTHTYVTQTILFASSFAYIDDGRMCIHGRSANENNNKILCWQTQCDLWCIACGAWMPHSTRWWAGRHPAAHGAHYNDPVVITSKLTKVPATTLILRNRRRQTCVCEHATFARKHTHIVFRSNESLRSSDVDWTLLNNSSGVRCVVYAKPIQCTFARCISRVLHSLFWLRAKRGPTGPCCECTRNLSNVYLLVQPTKLLLSFRFN